MSLPSHLSHNQISQKQEECFNYSRVLIQKCFHIILQSRCQEGNGKRATSINLTTQESNKELFDINISSGASIKSFPYYKEIKNIWIEEVKKLLFNSSPGMNNILASQFTQIHGNQNEANQIIGKKIAGIKLKLFFRETSNPNFPVHLANFAQHQPIEEWIVILNNENKDLSEDQVKNYFKMSSLIKSVLTMTRISAGYQFAKEYDYDTYFYYKIEPFRNLSDVYPNPTQQDSNSLFEVQRIGFVSTLIGTIEIYYRLNSSMCIFGVMKLFLLTILSFSFSLHQSIS